MLKKSLIFGSIVLIFAVLVALTGCEGPMGPAGLDGINGADGAAGSNGTAGTNGTNGADGTAGTNGTAGADGTNGTNGTDGSAGANGLIGGIVLYAGSITGDDLEAAFDATETTVILGSGVTDVFGEVPANKTLRVLGNTAVGNGETLTLNGGLVLYSVSAALHADVISGTSGGLVVEETGSISGSGELYLPVATDSSSYDYATYQSVSFANKEVGSFAVGGGSATATDIASAAASDITTIFGLADGPDELTVSGAITSLSANFEVPAEKKLTLTGASTFGTGDYLVTVAGTLILGSAATGFAPAGDVEVTGTLVLDTGSVITIANGKVLTLADSVSGGGTIVAQGSGSSEGTITIASVAGYTTSAGGVAGTALATAVAAITAETALTDSALIDLNDTFGASVTGIGSIEIIASSSPAAVQNTADGSSGTAVQVGTGITLAGSTIIADGGGTDTFTPGNFALSLENTTEVSIADSAHTGSNPTYGILEISGVQLQHGNLIGPELPAFHIGVKTSR